MTIHDTPQRSQAYSQAQSQALHQDLADDPGPVIRDAFMRELLREVEHEGRIVTRLALMTRALVDKANGGDVAAIREVLDRTVGKALPGASDSEAGPEAVTVEWLDHAP